MADGGTLFIDEIGRCVSVYPGKTPSVSAGAANSSGLGESVTRKTDARIIAATKPGLARGWCENGEFREDLFTDSRCFPCTCPRCVTVKDDIGLLIGHFIDKFNKQTGKSLTGLAPIAALTMMDYCWPGNIREFGKTPSRARLCHFPAGRTEIGIFDLPLEIRHVDSGRPHVSQKKVDALRRD